MPEGAKKNAPRGRVYMLLVAPQGFEPRSSESESLVLPLNEGATQCVPAGYTRDRHFCKCTGLAELGQTCVVGKPLPTPPAAWRCSRRER